MRLAVGGLAGLSGGAGDAAPVADSLSVTQSTSSTGYSETGDPIGLGFLVTNSGKATLTGVAVVDTVDDGRGEPHLARGQRGVPDLASFSGRMHLQPADGRGRSIRHLRAPAVEDVQASDAKRDSWRRSRIVSRFGPCYFKMLTARAITRPRTARQAVACTAIASLAQRASGMTSVGLNAVALVKAR